MSNEVDRQGSSALGSRARRTASRHPDDDIGHRPWRASDFPSDDAYFQGCEVKLYEDFPNHLHRLLKKLGIRYRWLLTRTALAIGLMISEDLAIDDAKEDAWMTIYADDSDTLE
jgi:hypothetical protein